MTNNKGKPDLTDITFVIPFFNDSIARIENCKYILNYLHTNFNTNILLVEQGKEHTPELSFFRDFPVDYHIIRRDDGIFHRTHAINEGIKLADTPYIANYDCDVIFDVGNYVRAYELLQQGYMFVYPYDGCFVDISRDIIISGKIKENQSYVNGSYGGAVFVNKAKYIQCGMENENMISWGSEDKERKERVETLGLRVVRVGGKCYHITHKTGLNSSPQNPFLEANKKELLKIEKMDAVQLKEYIGTWCWVKEAKGSENKNIVLS